MSAVRVTQGMMVARSLNDLGLQTQRLLNLQEQLSTGLRVNSPSDSPLAARRAVNIRSAIAKAKQYQSNASTAGPTLSESTASLQTVLSAVQRARVLALEGSTGTNSQVQMDQIASEVNQLVESVLEETNHQTNQRYVFGGTRTLNAPFVATRDSSDKVTSVAYTGNDESINIAVGDGSTVKINATGQSAFLSTQDIFQTLIGIRDDLQSGNKTSLQTTRLTELTDTQNQLLVSIAGLGAVQNRLDRVSSNMDTSIQENTVALSDNIDGDYAETVINLNAQSNAYTAALNVAARVIQPTLLNFLS